MIDLSCNSGGNAAIVMYIMAMITNNNYDSYTASYRKLQTLTGNISRIDHDMDLKLDGEINDLDKSVYYDFEYAFITSKNSYSCGNLLPCLAKDAGFPILDVTCVQKHIAEYTSGTGKTGDAYPA